MGKGNSLAGRGIRYIRKHGIMQLYRKVMERRLQNQMERPYSRWLQEQQPDEAQLQAQRARQFEKSPKISVLVPTYETPEEFLRQMVESLCDQTYGNWELCIADGSCSDLVKETLQPYMERDDRIRYQKLEKNLGISENTNAALAMATGEWIGLLDHDDILYPQTLYEIAAAMEAHPEAEAFYTDEDKISFDLQEHFQPHFKPDFNRELLRSNNYICHFFVVKYEIAREIGGFSSAFDGAQDYDFILRCTEKAREVCHIPQILYSWRCHASSTAANPESKLYAYEAGKRAVAAHLQRAGEAARVLDTDNYGFYRVRYDGWEEVAGGVSGIDGQEKISILRNSFEKIHGQNSINVVYYDKACNKIVTFGKKDGTQGYVLFTHVKKGLLSADFFRELLSTCDRPGVGMVCARVYEKSGRLAHQLEMAGVNNPFGQTMKGLKKGYLGYFHRACLQQEVVQATDCFLMKAELFEQVSSSISGETLDVQQLTQQVRKLGYAVVYDPWAVLYEK